MAKKVEEYHLKIKKGFPKPRYKTEYSTKLPGDELIRVGETIQPGEYIEDVSLGSAGKLEGFVKARGLEAVRRGKQGDSRITLYVVTPEWLAEHPEVLKPTAIGKKR
jgi:hypothetical protein